MFFAPSISNVRPTCTTDTTKTPSPKEEQARVLALIQEASFWSFPLAGSDEDNRFAIHKEKDNSASTKAMMTTTAKSKAKTTTMAATTRSKNNIGSTGNCSASSMASRSNNVATSAGSTSGNSTPNKYNNPNDNNLMNGAIAQQMVLSRQRHPHQNQQQQPHGGRQDKQHQQQQQQHQQPNQLDSSGRSTNSSGSAAAAASNWRVAVDPHTGRAYYYDAVTRRSQWEKPPEIKAKERKERHDKKRRDMEFFRIMEENIRASLRRGEVLPGCTARSPHLMATPNAASDADKKVSKKLVAQRPAAIKVRTISGMEACLLQELNQKEPSPLFHHHQQQAESTQPPELYYHPQQFPRPRHENEHTYSSISTSSSTASSLQPPYSIPQEFRPSQSQCSSAILRGGAAAAAAACDGFGVDEGGRPPLPRNSIPGLARSLSSSSLELSPEQEVSPSKFRLSSSLSMTTTNTSPNPRVLHHQGSSMLSLLSRGDDPAQETLVGEALLDGPMIDEEDQFVVAAVIMDDDEVSGSSPTAVTSAGAVVSIPKPSVLSSHFRRNTGGTIHIKSTMDNPNIEATIKCVCGVYRAHILQAASSASKTSRSNLNSPNSVMMSASLSNLPTTSPDEVMFEAISQIYLDAPARRKHMQQQYQHFLNASSSLDDPLNGGGSKIPSLQDIINFYQDFYKRSQMEHDTIIFSLIYVERLMKETNGIVSPSAENWMSILFSCMVLASKVWDDLSMWNIDFSNVCGRKTATSSSSPLMAFTLKRINQLELALLKALNFNVKVPASEYAKYYFLIRTMLMKSGLLKEEHDRSSSSSSPSSSSAAGNANGTTVSPSPLPSHPALNVTSNGHSLVTHLSSQQNDSEYVPFMMATSTNMTTTTSFMAQQLQQQQRQQQQQQQPSQQEPRNNGGGLHNLTDTHAPATNRRCRSMNDYLWFDPTPDIMENARFASEQIQNYCGPTLTSTVCLEQLVSMQH